MTNTKRVSELVAGDIVIFPGEKGVMTISKIEKLSEKLNWGYIIYCAGIERATRYQDDTEVIYLGTDKKKETMKEEKRVEVDISAIYPYFDLLASKEVSLQNATNIPAYVKEQLKYIHELFEDVLDLTLAEVKALYFGRKMSKREPEVEKTTKTKKVKDLCIGDRVVVLEVEKIVTKLEDSYSSDTHITITFQDDSCCVYKKDKVVTVVLS